MMNLILNDKKYEIEKMSLQARYIDSDENAKALEDDGPRGVLNQNLTITLKDASIISEVNLELVESMIKEISIESNGSILTFNGFVFETFDAYLNNEEINSFDLRFHKYE